MNPHTPDPDATEAFNRTAWHLRETGEFPTPDQLREIRRYKRAEGRAA